jgi:hypothetical protein
VVYPTWKTRILSLGEVPANQALGYGGTYANQSSPGSRGIVVVAPMD